MLLLIMGAFPKSKSVISTLGLCQNYTHHNLRTTAFSNVVLSCSRNDDRVTEAYACLLRGLC